MSFVRAGISHGLNQGFCLLRQAASFFHLTKTPPQSDIKDEYILVVDPKKVCAKKQLPFFPEPLDSLQDADKILKLNHALKKLRQLIANPAFYFSPFALHRYESRMCVIDLSDERTRKVVLQCLLTLNNDRDYSAEVIKNLHVRTVKLANQMIEKLEKILIVQSNTEIAEPLSPRLT